MTQELFNFGPYDALFLERLRAFVKDFEAADSRSDFQQELVLLGLFAKEMCKKGLTRSPEEIFRDGL
jgi:hypothetical protein